MGKAKAISYVCAALCKILLLVLAVPPFCFLSGPGCGSLAASLDLALSAGLIEGSCVRASVCYNLFFWQKEISLFQQVYNTFSVAL